MLKKGIFYFLGLLLMGLGTVVLLESNLGIAAFDALCYGMSNIINLSIGVCCMILGLFIIAINAVIQKRYPSIYSFLTSIVVGWCIDFWLNFVNLDITIVWLKGLVFIFGLIINTFGIALYISANLVKGPIDQLMINISHLLKKEVWLGKTLMETTFLALAVIVKGPIGIGTLVITFGSGIFINFFLNILKEGVIK